MAKAWVAGATGYTGRALVEALADAGHQAIAHVRPSSTSRGSLIDAWTARGVTVRELPWDEDALTTALQDDAPDLIFCLIGTTRKSARAERAQAGTEVSYETIDYGLTAMLLRATRAAGLTQSRFVYLSAMGVSPRPINAYMAARWRAEEAVRASGLPYTIVRPGFISGADREEFRPMERAGVLVSDAAVGLLGALGAKRLRARYLSVDASILARNLLRLALDPDLSEGTVEAEALDRTGA